MAEAESMATVYPAARNLCAAATYMRLCVAHRTSARIYQPQQPLLRRSGGLTGRARGEGVGRDQGFVGSGLLNEPTSSGDAHVGAKACGPLLVSREAVLA